MIQIKIKWSNVKRDKSKWCIVKGYEIRQIKVKWSNVKIDKSKLCIVKGDEKGQIKVKWSNVKTNKSKWYIVKGYEVKQLKQSDGKKSKKWYKMSILSLQNILSIIWNSKKA